ncbi:MAG: hypothetical protein ABSB91_06415 [Sedimentisphaerales bacterium]
MSESILNIEGWRLPKDMTEYQNYLSILKSNDRKISRFVLTGQISQFDLYCYLKARFGIPNGIAMAFRAPTSENMIQWSYLVIANNHFIELVALNTYTSICIHGTDTFDESRFKALVENIMKDFQRIDSKLSEIKRSLEKWTLFVNPYKRIEDIVDSFERQLKAINLDTLALPQNPSKSEEMEPYHARLQKCQVDYSKAVELGTSLSMIIPVLGESFINLLIFICAKPEIKNDKRMYESTIRNHIDVKIKSLHLYCEGFNRPIDSSKQEFKEFHSLMNSRNDLLHGGIDPHKLMYDEVYFDNTIPLFKHNQSFAERTLLPSLQLIEPKVVLRNIEIVKYFIKFVIGHLSPDYKKYVELVMGTSQPGWREKTKTVGVLFSETVFDGFFV